MCLQRKTKLKKLEVVLWVGYDNNSCVHMCFSGVIFFKHNLKADFVLTGMNDSFFFFLMKKIRYECLSQLHIKAKLIGRLICIYRLND